MKRQQIYEAYDAICPDQAAKERMLQNILSASDSQPAGKDVPMRKYHKRRPLLVAAMLAAMLLLVGCAAVVVMRLNDLRIGEHTQSYRAYFDENGVKIPAMEVTKDVISLQGIGGTANQMAAQEWYQFTENYEGEYAEEAYQAPRMYDAYSVNSQEMIDKVDEIAKKYSLKLAGQKEFVMQWQSDVFHDILGIDSPFKENAQVEIPQFDSPLVDYGLPQTLDLSGCIYECGNFELGFGCNVSSEEFQWKYPLYGKVLYHDKAYMAVDYFTVTDAETAEQWNYTLEDGTEVLIVNDDWAYVFCDREDAFVSAMFVNCYYEGGIKNIMSKRDIELAAELIDFTVKPQKPDMTELVKQLEAAEQEYYRIMAEWEGEDPFRKDSYKEVADAIGMAYYTLIDINGDGMEECLLKGEHGNLGLYTMIDGKTEPLIEGNGLYLCENNVVERYEEVGERYYIIHGYYRLEGNELVTIDRIVYDQVNEEWYRSNDGIRAEEILSTEEAEKIIASYARVDIEMKPISEFPMS